MPAGSGVPGGCARDDPSHRQNCTPQAIAAKAPVLDLIVSPLETCANPRAAIVCSLVPRIDQGAPQIHARGWFRFVRRRFRLAMVRFG